MTTESEQEKITAKRLSELATAGNTEELQKLRSQNQSQFSDEINKLHNGMPPVGHALLNQQAQTAIAMCQNFGASLDVRVNHGEEFNAWIYRREDTIEKWHKNTQHNLTMIFLAAYYFEDKGNTSKNNANFFTYLANQRSGFVNIVEEFGRLKGYSLIQHLIKDKKVMAVTHLAQYANFSQVTNNSRATLYHLALSNFSGQEEKSIQICKALIKTHLQLLGPEYYSSLNFSTMVDGNNQNVMCMVKITNNPALTSLFENFLDLAPKLETSQVSNLEKPVGVLNLKKNSWSSRFTRVFIAGRFAGLFIGSLGSFASIYFLPKAAIKINKTFSFINERKLFIGFTGFSSLFGYLIGWRRDAKKTQEAEIKEGLKDNLYSRSQLQSPTTNAQENHQEKQSNFHSPINNNQDNNKGKSPEQDNKQTKNSNRDRGCTIS